MRKALFETAVGVTVAMSVSACAAEHTKDSLAEVKKAVADGNAVLIDVREMDEWKDGHLTDAKHLPLSDIKAGIPEAKLKNVLPANKVIYLHCAAGGRCLKAAELLKEKGYETRPLKSGYATLLKEGFEKAK